MVQMMMLMRRSRARLLLGGERAADGGADDGHRRSLLEAHVDVLESADAFDVAFARAGEDDGGPLRGPRDRATRHARRGS